MKTIILAAGRGSRLQHFSLDRPKCLIEINGKALLDYQLGVLHSQDINNIILIKGYLASSLERYRVKSYINTRYAETNMVWTLFCARKELEGDIIVSYGDIVYSREALQALIASPYDISVIVDLAWEEYWKERYDNPLDDVESLKTDHVGRIVDIGQPPQGLDSIQGQYIGLIKFSASGTKILRDVFDNAVHTGDLQGKYPEKAYMTDILQAIIKADYDVWPVFIEGGWVEVDTVKDLSLPITRDRLASIDNSLAVKQRNYRNS